MNQLAAIALGGALGAVLRFLISTGVYQWLGRDFPYGTLAVNVIGSFLIGLMTEALILQRIALSMEYRSAILVGLFGSLTTFSTFSLDTISLLEQGQFSKASLNVFGSVIICLLVVWIGLNIGKLLFSQPLYGSVNIMSWVVPHALLVVNVIGAFLIGFVCTLLLTKIALPQAQGIALVVILVGLFMTLSSLYLVLYFMEQGYGLDSYLSSVILTVIVTVVVNIGFCSLALWLGFLSAKQI